MLEWCGRPSKKFRKPELREKSKKVAQFLDNERIRLCLMTEKCIYTSCRKNRRSWGSLPNRDWSNRSFLSSSGE